MRQPAAFQPNRPEPEIEVDMESETESEDAFDRAVRIYEEDKHELDIENKIKSLKEDLEYLRDVREVWRYRLGFDDNYSYMHCSRNVDQINIEINATSIELARLTARPRLF